MHYFFSKNPCIPASKPSGSTNFWHERKKKKAEETCHITIVEIFCFGIIFLAVSKIYAFIYLFVLEVNVFDIIYIEI